MDNPDVPALVGQECRRQPVTDLAGVTNRPIRVAHFSFADSDGGAAKAAYRLHSALRAQGVDGRLHVLRKGTDDSSVVSVTSHARFGTLASELAPRLDLLPIKLAHPKARAYWSSGWYGSVDPLTLPGVAEADVLCLYWVTRGLLGIRQIERLLSTGKPVVWRLSDMWPFTGGCHYSSGCERFTANCGQCPQLQSHGERDLSRWMLSSKLRRWRKGNLIVVSPSRWMADLARKSRVFAERSIHVIPTGVDLELFRTMDREIARDILGLPHDRPLVLYGATSALTDTRKGSDVVVEAFRALYEIPEVQKIAPGLVLFGTSRIPPGLPADIPVYPLGLVRDEAMLPIVYSACDIFAAPSREENLANSVLEAMACGLPVIAYKVGGMLDAIEHGHTGLLVDPADKNAMADGLRVLLEEHDLRQPFGRNARQRAEQQFSLSEQARAYAALYAELLR